MFNRDVFNDIFFRVIFRIKESKITKIDDGRERSVRGETAFFVHKELFVIETSRHSIYLMGFNYGDVFFFFFFCINCIA